MQGFLACLCLGLGLRLGLGSGLGLGLGVGSRVAWLLGVLWIRGVRRAARTAFTGTRDAVLWRRAPCDRLSCGVGVRLLAALRGGRDPRAVARAVDHRLGWIAPAVTTHGR